MQSKLRILGLGFFVLMATGCSSTRWNWLKQDPVQEAPAAKVGAAPTTAALVAYLNDNANRVRTVRVDDMAIDVTIENQSFGIRGRIFAEKPRNFRMKSTFLGKDEVDIGSNASEFWFWAAKNPDPRQYQYFCTYKDLDEGRVRMMPLPIQPEWVMEAMGLGPYGPAEKYELDARDSKMYRLIERAKSPQGQPVRKVMVMHRQAMRSPQPQVVAFLLLDDASGKEICSAHITSTIIDRVTGAILPYKMELRMPTQKMKLALKMDSMKINEPLAGTIFQRQQMTGVEPFNLATGRPEPWGVQRTQGIGGN